MAHGFEGLDTDFSLVGLIATQITRIERRGQADLILQTVFTGKARPLILVIRVARYARIGGFHKLEDDRSLVFKKIGIAPAHRQQAVERVEWLRFSISNKQAPVYLPERRQTGA